MSHQHSDALNWNELSIEDILELAIADEEEAQEYYRHAAECVGNMHTRRMLLKLSEADSEVVRLTQELLDHVKAEQDIQARLHAAKQHRKVLQGIAFKKPGVMRRLAYADYLLEPGDKTRDQLQRAIDKERPGDGEH